MPENTCSFERVFFLSRLLLDFFFTHKLKETKPMKLIKLHASAQVNYVYEQIYLYQQTFTDPTALELALKWLAFECISVRFDAKYWITNLKQIMRDDTQLAFKDATIFTEFAKHLTNQQNEFDNHHQQVNEWVKTIQAINDAKRKH